LPKKSLKAKKVLVWSEYANIAQTVLDILTDSDYKVKVANDLDQLRSEMTASGADLVVLDPDSLSAQSRKGVIKQIAALSRANARACGIMIISSYAGCLEQRRFGEMGVGRVLSKPFKVDEMLEAVKCLTGLNSDADERGSEDHWKGEQRESISTRFPALGVD
jgi:DNA-binding response OmpR family regulator